MANYVAVLSVEQLPPGKDTVVTIEGKDIALFNVDGTGFTRNFETRWQDRYLSRKRIEI